MKAAWRVLLVDLATIDELSTVVSVPITSLVNKQDVPNILFLPPLWPRPQQEHLEMLRGDRTPAGTG